MKVKIFCGCNIEVLEERINRFIRNKCIIKVLQSVSSSGFSNCLIITILYEDNFFCDYVRSKFCKPNKLC